MHDNQLWVVLHKNICGDRVGGVMPQIEVPKVLSGVGYPPQQLAAISPHLQYMPMW